MLLRLLVVVKVVVVLKVMMMRRQTQVTLSGCRCAVAVPLPLRRCVWRAGVCRAPRVGRAIIYSGRIHSRAKGNGATAAVRFLFSGTGLLTSARK